MMHICHDITALENHIQQTHNINIKLKIKPMNEGIIIPYEPLHPVQPLHPVPPSNKDIITLLKSPHTDEDYAECFVNYVWFFCNYYITNQILEFIFQIDRQDYKFKEF